MLTADAAARLEARVPALAGRVQQAAALQALVAKGQWPASPAAAFMLPLGLRARSEGDASAGAFTQSADEMLGVLLVLNAAGDPTGGKALPPVDQLTDEVIAALCGWAPPGRSGVLRLVRGQLIENTGGRILYQLDFSTLKQIRIFS